jgi:hypothetical protein
MQKRARDKKTKMLPFQARGSRGGAKGSKNKIFFFLVRYIKASNAL